MFVIHPFSHPEFKLRVEGQKFYLFTTVSWYWELKYLLGESFWNWDLDERALYPACLPNVCILSFLPSSLQTSWGPTQQSCLCFSLAQRGETEAVVRRALLERGERLSFSVIRQSEEMKNLKSIFCTFLPSSCFCWWQYLILKIILCVLSRVLSNSFYLKLFYSVVIGHTVS